MHRISTGLWQFATRRLRWVLHPITVFVALQIVWLATTLIWVIWFVGQIEAISVLARAYGGNVLNDRTTLMTLIVGCVLLGVICIGTIMLFVSYQRQNRLARQQRSFVSSVTHELKSPLASLQLTVETMGSHRLDESMANRLLTFAQSDIDRLRRLVDQILVAGRIDRGVLAFDDTEDDIVLEELIKRVMGNLSYLDQRLFSRLVVHVHPDLKISTSSTALMLILNNLMENAVKYSPKGTPITIAAEKRDGLLHLSIADLGIGLDPNDRRRLFRMFHRGDRAVSKAIPGTGLGLYIVRSAVRVLGGTITAESRGKDQGAVFRITLPLIRPKADQVSAANQGELKSKGGSVKFRRFENRELPRATAPRLRSRPNPNPKHPASTNEELQ